MKKVAILFAVLGLGTFFSIILILFMVGGISTSSQPINPPASEEQAYQYQYIGSELGIPWDIVLLVDAVLADAEGKDNIEDCNPMNTTLEFCKIREEEFEAVVQYDEEGNPLLDEEGNEIIEWQSTGRVTYYSGAADILAYIGKGDIEYTAASVLMADIKEAAEAKKTEDLKYEVALVHNSNYEYVMRYYLGLSEEDITYIMELYHANYLVYLYGYIPGNEYVELPDIVIGDVGRDDLAHVAVSIINHPYQMGGKSASVGAPSGPLDCSGFVDWVYMQCFGKVVSSGNLPSGVALSGTALQYYACTAIRENELKVGDLGFIYDPAQMKAGDINHVGIYIGKINGRNAFVHCAGKYYGYEDRPTGRVGISISGGTNSKNPVTGGTFSPAMKGCTFRYFRRPNFQFKSEG